MSSHQRKQRSTECKSCSALLSPSQLSHKLVFVRSTQRKLGPPPPSFLYSFWLFGLCLLLFLLPWCQKTSKSRPTMLLKLQDCRSAALVQLQLPPTAPAVRFSWVKAKMLHLCTDRTAAAQTPGQLASSSDTTGWFLSIWTCKGSSLSMCNIFAPPFMVNGAWERGQVS